MQLQYASKRLTVFYKMSKGESGFGWMRVDDRGDHIDVTYSGRNNRNEEKISLKFTVPASPTTTAAKTR